MEKRDIVFGPKSDIKQERARTMRRKMTPAETYLWAHLRGNQCGGLHFRRQQIIDGFIADFYCHAAGLIVEVDGAVHQQQADYDVMRDRILTARGLRLLRISNDRIFNRTLRSSKRNSIHRARIINFRYSSITRKC